MKNLTAILLNLGSSNIVAQYFGAPQTNAEVKKFTVGAFFSPDVANRLLQSADGDDRTEKLIESRNANETAKFGYTAGLNIAYQITDNFALEMGLENSNKGFQTKKTAMVFGDIVDPRTGFTPSDPLIPSNAHFIGEFQNIGIPVKLNYTAGKGKWKFISSIGFTAEFLLRANTTLVRYYADGNTDQDKEKSQYDYKSFSLSPSISAGADYQLNSRMSLRAMPTVRAGLIPIIDAPIAGYLYSAGMQFG